ncbi:hypothetical protein [Kitasatospora sp. NPDC087315]|uniref:hypothetical protein n=1 Tax=Kitasatospora sp. NPDC087315 TaxID=3364069 RepID=UPI0037FB1C77
MADSLRRSREDRAVVHGIGMAVWEDLPLVLEALSSFADKQSADAQARNALATKAKTGEDKARKRSEAFEMMTSVQQSEQLKQRLIDAGRQLNDERIADLT